MTLVVTMANVHSGRRYDVCDEHEDCSLVGDAQVYRGRHRGMCVICTMSGADYLAARAMSWRRLAAVLGDVARYDSLGDVVLRDEAARTVDELALEWTSDGRRLYRRSDIVEAARWVERSCGEVA